MTLDFTYRLNSDGLSSELGEELHQLDMETFEVEDLPDVGLEAASCGCSSSCSTSSCCSCSTSSCCSCSTSSCGN